MFKFIQRISTIFCLAISTLAWAQPAITGVTISSPKNTINGYGRYEKVELAVNLINVPTTYNWYDYNDVALSATFTNGTTNITVDGFYAATFNHQPPSGVFTYTSSGRFLIRFTPPKVGLWTYKLNCTVKNYPSITNYTPSSSSFICSERSYKGFISKGNSNYLQRDVNSVNQQFIPIGENLCWSSNMTDLFTDYPTWINALSNANGNHTRLWMSDWSFGLEWKNQGTHPSQFGGLKRYHQGRAYFLDWIVEYMAQKNMSFMLCLNHHGQLSSQINAKWYDNPNNSANGGSCATPQAFFSDATAKTTYKNQLRYIVARWGYATNISAWELFNEVDLTEGFPTALTATSPVKMWHDEMATYLKSIDPNKHLVTTSFAHEGNDAAIWQLSKMDFTQTHYYDNNPNLEKPVTALTQAKRATYVKPTLIGEVNLNYDGAGLSSNDPTGIHLHNTVWASMLSGNLGNAMSWYWDSYIQPKNLYGMYLPLANFVNTTPLLSKNYQPTTTNLTYGSGGTLGNCTITPNIGWGMANSTTFSLANNCVLTPSESNLSTYIIGTNAAQFTWRKPPTFNATYLAAGQFSFMVDDLYPTSNGNALQRITISINGVLQNIKVNNAAATSNQPLAVIGSTYTVDVPQGTRNIQVNNLGNDWFRIKNYNFTNVTSSCQSTFGSVNLTPLYTTWASTPTNNTFTLGSNGSLTPNTNNLASYLYGNLSKNNRVTIVKKAVQITATFLSAGQFSLNIVGSSGWQNTLPPTAKVTVAKLNSTMISNTFPIMLNTSGQTCTMPISSAGVYTITVDNVGDDWYKIGSYTFTNVVNSVDIYAMKATSDNKEAIAWLHNINYTHLKPNPTAINCGTMQLTGMAAGKYNVNWTDTYSGATLLATTVHSDVAGNLSVNIPSFNKDIALKLNWYEKIKKMSYQQFTYALLTTIIHHFCMTTMTRLTRLSQREEAYLNEIQQNWEGYEAFGEADFQIQLNQAAEKVAVALQQLCEDCRRIFQIYFLEEKSERETLELLSLNISRDAFQSRIKQCKLKFQSAFLGVKVKKIGLFKQYFQY
jgi:DNA-directed RNA polymerase specialized sigma24 family protein